MSNVHSTEVIILCCKSGVCTYTRSNSSVETDEVIALNNKRMWHKSRTAPTEAGYPGSYYIQRAKTRNERNGSNKGKSCCPARDSHPLASKRSGSHDHPKYFYRAAGVSERLRLLSDSWTETAVSGWGVDERLRVSGVARRESWANSPMSLQGIYC